MTVTARTTSRSLERPAPSTLDEVVDIILDKGMVVDVAAQVAVLGIEVLFVDARIVMASIDSYLRFADMLDRLDATAAPASGRRTTAGRAYGQRASVPRRSATA